MNVSKKDLEERFKALTDEALLDRLQAGTLTPIATEVALAELRSRGIETAASAEAPDASTPDELDESADPDSDIDLVTVAQFSNVLEANVLRNCLESHGVFAYVWGEHLGVANVFLSTISGGMRVQVRQDQVERAKEIMTALERGDLAIDEEPE